MSNINNLISKENTLKQNRVWVRISSTCNNKCIFCLDSHSQNWTFIDDNNIKEKIKNWYKIWYDNRVIISWWEASINPKFFEYIKYSKKIWYDRIQTITNWNMFNNYDFCKNVIEAWLQEVTFSFHGHNSKLHDFLVDTPNAFKKSLRWLLNLKKFFPQVIVNIDIVVNKINVEYLPDIIKFFMKLWVYEYDILQIIPIWRWFIENKSKLFYDVSEYTDTLKKTWELSRIPWVYMWTNRFPAEVFEWYEDLIQDPRKIKSEVMWEAYYFFDRFIKSNWEKKVTCFWEACNYCFQKKYCHDFLENINTQKISINEDYLVIEWENSPKEIYLKYWKNSENFFNTLRSFQKKLINIPKCLWWSWIYQTYNDLKQENTLEDYTYNYIKNLYRVKSLNCKKCKYNNECKWIHINFVRSYWFKILKKI